MLTLSELFLVEELKNNYCHKTSLYFYVPNKIIHKETVVRKQNVALCTKPFWMNSTRWRFKLVAKTRVKFTENDPISHTLFINTKYNNGEHNTATGRVWILVITNEYRMHQKPTRRATSIKEIQTATILVESWASNEATDASDPSQTLPFEGERWPGSSPKNERKKVETSSHM